MEGNETPLETHRARQAQFNIECLRTLKRKNRSWVFLSDTDEFVTINPRKSKKYKENPLFPELEKLPLISEPGSVMTFLK
eukprot:CAMPEP_0194311218 /NCGR_PEP_ID=MMETSP0171-20130528/8218_1 /TAXON_ID=218684 /ORGANISM="Corethron pennatum, Strain L29A3" /LENGTH=79 /DNA_ID=CAMNT_0039065239 /DNA_START=47 /DNA_END=283 /DNA_ORIENTATION=+